MRPTKQSIEDFLKVKKYFFYGVSSDKSKFGNSVFKHLSDNGYNPIPVHPELEEINGFECIKDISKFSGEIQSAIIILNPVNTEKVVRDLINIGIKKIWVQQRSESESIFKICKENDVELITGECILMFTDPVSLVHRIHKFINKVTGRLPV